MSVTIAMAVRLKVPNSGHRFGTAKLKKLLGRYGGLFFEKR